MKYPSFLQKNDLIGLPAPSNGMKEEDREKFENAIKKFEKQGFLFEISKNAFNRNEFVSAEAIKRADEFSSMWKNEKIKGLISLGGGEFMMEILPFLQSKEFANATPKWFQGFSDNTILNHYLLTHLDCASIYHYNFKYFGAKKWHESLFDSFDCLTGKKLTFHNYKKFQEKREENEKPLACFNLTKKVKWEILTNEKEVCFQGRAVGGCIDVLLMYLGTNYDKTQEFLAKYKDDGFVWFLESCDLDARATKRALWQFKENNWFKNVKGFVFGRPLMGESCEKLTNKSAILSMLKEFDVPIIFGADLGHKPPIIPIIMGSKAKVECNGKKAKVEFLLK